MAAELKGKGVWIDAKRWRGALHFALRDDKWVCVKAFVPAAQFFVGWPSMQVRAYCATSGWEFREVGRVKV